MIKLADWNDKLDIIVGNKLKLDKDLLGLDTEPIGNAPLKRRLNALKINF